VKLTLMINIINGWNRIAVGFGGFVDPAAVKASNKAAAAQAANKAAVEKAAAA